MEAVSLAQDPVSFLAEIRDECPEIMSIFTREQVKMLSVNPMESYSEGKVDEEYLLEASFHQNFRIAWKQSSKSLSSFLLKPEKSTKSFTIQDLETFEKKRSALEKVCIS